MTNPDVDTSPEFIAARVAWLRMGDDDPEEDLENRITANILEAIAADRDRLAKERDEAKSMLTQWSSTFANIEWRQLKKMTVERDEARRELAEIITDRDRLAKERDEADRRADAAERQLAYVEETMRSSRHWMSERKRELDDVWAAAIARAEKAEAERDEFRRLPGAMK